MRTSSSRLRYLTCTAVTTGLLGLCACASLEVTEDLGSAQELVAQRSGVAVDWGGPWDPRTAAAQLREARLTADDVARLALHNHAGIRGTVESIAQARADFVQAHLLPNPVLNFTLGFAVDGGSGTPAMASLLQPLAALWQRPAAIDSQSARLRAAVLATSNAALELVARARLAHAELVFADRDLALAEQVRDLAAMSFELVEEGLAVGEAAPLDRNRVAVEVLEAEAHLTDANVRRDRARRALLEVCGIAGEPSMPSTDDTPVAVPAWVTELAEGEFVQMAEEQRLDLAAARTLGTGAIDAVRLAELRRISGISIGAGFQRNFEGRQAVGPALALEIPIFDDGRAGVASAESLARAAAAETERVRQVAIAEVRAAWVQLRGGAVNLERLRGSVLALAAENRELAELSLAEGVLGRGTVLDLARREVRVRLTVSEVELAVVESYIELERAVGGRVVEPGDGK